MNVYSSSTRKLWFSSNGIHSDWLSSHCPCIQELGSQVQLETGTKNQQRSGSLMAKGNWLDELGIILHWVLQWFVLFSDSHTSKTTVSFSRTGLLSVSLYSTNTDNVVCKYKAIIMSVRAYLHYKINTCMWY